MDRVKSKAAKKPYTEYSADLCGRFQRDNDAHSEPSVFLLRCTAQSEYGRARNGYACRILHCQHAIDGLKESFPSITGITIERILWYTEKQQLCEDRDSQSHWCGWSWRRQRIR